MKHFAGALVIVVLCGAGSVIGAGCDQGVSEAAGGALTAAGGAPAAGGGTARATGGAAGSAAHTGGAAGSVANAGGAAGATSTGDPLPVNAVEVALTPSADGFVNSALGVLGAWYAYGDGNDGAKPGVCQTVGMHQTAECSVITAPVPGMPFAPVGTSLSQMCTSGTVAKVINFGDPPSLDFSNIFGAGIGLDLNNPGLDGGTGVKMPFNAPSKMVIGISFTLDAVPSTGLRVEFPFGTSATAAGVWKPHPTTYASPVAAGHNILLFANVKQPAYVKMADMIPFDPTTLTSIQFHIPTTASGASAYHFCIDNLALIVQM